MVCLRCNLIVSAHHVNFAEISQEAKDIKHIGQLDKEDIMQWPKEIQWHTVNMVTWTNLTFAVEDEASKSHVTIWLSVNPTSVVLSPVGCHNTLQIYPTRVYPIFGQMSAQIWLIIELIRFFYYHFLWGFYKFT